MQHLWPALLSTLLFLALRCRADQQPYYQDARFNDGEYGRYVMQEFKTRPEMVPPRINFMQPFNRPECDDGSYLFIAPRGNVPNASFYIMDSE